MTPKENMPDYRKICDTVGYCSKPKQIEKVVELSVKLEKEELKSSSKLLKGVQPIAALCPHDDHLYAGRIYVHVIKPIADANTVIIFGVTHGRAKKYLGKEKKSIILENYNSWESPYHPVEIDTKLRAYIKKKLSKKNYVVKSKAHAAEHSIESMLPFLQYYNRNIKLLPIMIPKISFKRMDILSNALSECVAGYVKKYDLKFGKDISILISVDATHYGPDFAYEPFGTDKKAHKMATDRDIRMGQKYLSKKITKYRIKGFVNEFNREKITWCGRYSVPFGLLTATKTAKLLYNKNLKGIPLRYSDSYSTGVLPLTNIGIGTTAPFSLKHWVGYWSIIFGI